MKKITSIIIMIFIISSCGKDVTSDEDTTKVNEPIIDSEETIEFTELEGQPDY